MAVMRTDDKNYTDIANAINTKAKNSPPKSFLPSEMAGAISSLPKGGGISNGKKWEPAKGRFFRGPFGPLCYGDGVWIAGSSNGDNGFLISTDGKNWRVPNFVDGIVIGNIAYGNGLWVATCVAARNDSSVGVWFSQDQGINWRQASFPHRPTKALAYANGKFIVGTRGDGLWQSTNGSEWVRINVDTGTPKLLVSTITHANGLWVACFASDYDSNLGLWYSENGEIWRQSNSRDSALFSISNVDGIWFAFEGRIWEGAALGLWVSKDGVSWEKVRNINEAIVAVVKLGNTFMAFGTTTWTSRDGVYWERDGTSPVFHCSKAASANGYVIAFDSNGMPFRKEANAEWEKVQVLRVGNVVSLSNNNGMWVACVGNEQADPGIYYSWEEEA